MSGCKSLIPARKMRCPNGHGSCLWEGPEQPMCPDCGSALEPEFDSVAQDAITQGVPIPPADLPLDQRRAYLGGEFAGQRGSTPHPSNPYREPGCAEAWIAGYQRMLRERRTG